MSRDRAKKIDDLRVIIKLVKRIDAGYGEPDDEARLSELMAPFELQTADQLLRDLCDMEQVGYELARPGVSAPKPPRGRSRGA